MPVALDDNVTVDDSSWTLLADDVIAIVVQCKSSDEVAIVLCENADAPDAETAAARGHLIGKDRADTWAFEGLTVGAEIHARSVRSDAQLAVTKITE